MTMPDTLMLVISLATTIIAILFLFFPEQAGKLEQKLNAPWGGKNVKAIRLGLPGEQRIEQALNRDVLEQRITWDGWARSRPRVVGIILCLVAAVLWWQTVSP